jgi:hypothetical protein
MRLTAWLQENENDKKLTVLIIHPNLCLRTKTLVLVLLCAINFRGRHKNHIPASRLKPAL